MTVLEFGKRDFRINYTIATCVCSCAVLLVASLFLYNQIIDVRHELTKNKATIEKMVVANAEMKVYATQYEDAVSSYVQGTNLVAEKTPVYAPSGTYIAAR